MSAATTVTHVLGKDGFDLGWDWAVGRDKGRAQGQHALVVRRHGGTAFCGEKLALGCCGQVGGGAAGLVGGVGGRVG